jgi:hypothetical protein
MSLTILYFLHMQYHVQIGQGLLIDVSNHLLYFLHVHHRRTKKQGALDRRSIKDSTTFSTHIAMYKKQETP